MRSRTVLTLREDNMWYTDKVIVNKQGTHRLHNLKGKIVVLEEEYRVEKIELGLRTNSHGILLRRIPDGSAPLSCRAWITMEIRCRYELRDDRRKEIVRSSSHINAVKRDIMRTMSANRFCASRRRRLRNPAPGKAAHESGVRESSKWAFFTFKFHGLVESVCTSF